MRGGGPLYDDTNLNKFSIHRPAIETPSRHRYLKRIVTKELCEIYSPSDRRINKKREYILLLASCILDWIALHEGTCKRTWSHKISDLFNSYVTIKRGNFRCDKRIEWNYDYKLIQQALNATSDDGLKYLYKVSCIKHFNLEKQMVYAMVNLDHNKIYVGRTNNLLRRLSEHIRCAFKHKHEGADTERVHAYMSHNKAQNWTLVPICAINNILADAKLAEARYIKLLHRNRLLNDDFHTRARNSTLSKKSKSFCRPNRYKTHRGKKPSTVSNYVPTQYIISDVSTPSTVVTSSYDFCRILQYLNSKPCQILQHTSVSTCGNLTELTNWTRVKYYYGQSMLTYKLDGNTHSVRLSKALRLIKSGEISSFVVNQVVTTIDKLTQVTLERIGKSKRVAKQICGAATLHELLSWRSKCYVIRNNKLRNYSACSIEKYLQSRFKLRYSKPYTIRLPYSPNLSMQAIKAQAMLLIDAMDTEPSYARLLKRRLRVVYTKRPSIEDFVSNHKKFCKEYKHSQPPSCVCDKFLKLPKVDGHVAFKATDVNFHLIKKCLHVNAKNIITPTEHSVTHEVKAAFGLFISELQDAHVNVFPDDTDLQSQVEDNLESFQIEIVNDLKTTDTCLPTMHDVIKFKRKYKGLVVCPLDKNTGCMFLCCPCYHRQQLQKTYTENKSYSKSKHKPSVILDRWETFYDKHNYSKWFSYPRRKAGDDSRLPSSYILPKNKDIKKARPITSYFNHPFKRVFNAAGRGLLHILESTREEHFNMSNVSDLMNKVEKLNEKCTQEKSCKRSCLCLNGDLANMYTSLDHTSIRKAVRWLLDCVRKTSRRKEVSIPISKIEGKTHLGRTGDADSKRINFTFDELLEIVDFDLDNTYFKVGDTMLQQKVGIPMGSPLSPALAQIICAFYESNTIKQARSAGITNEVDGVRYVDDLTAVIYYDPSSPLSTSNAYDLSKRIQYGYHPNMELEVEDTDEPFKFLSSMIRINKKTCKIRAKFHNKNTAQIKHSKPQLFLTYQHFESFAPVRQKSSVVISTIHRIGNACNSVQYAQKAFNLLCLELKGLRYPDKIILRALRRVRNKDPRWHAVSMLPGSNRRLVPSGIEQQKSTTEWPARGCMRARMEAQTA